MKDQFQSSSPIDSRTAEDFNQVLGDFIDRSIRSFQPRLQSFVNDFADRSLHLSQDAVRNFSVRVRENSRYRMGVMALLLVGLGIYVMRQSRGSGQVSETINPRLH